MTTKYLDTVLRTATTIKVFVSILYNVYHTSYILSYILYKELYPLFVQCCIIPGLTPGGVISFQFTPNGVSLSLPARPVARKGRGA